MFWKKSDFSKTELHTMANCVRLLALDAVQTAKSGHPGAPLGFADVITTLFANHLKFDPSVPDWDGRDVLILSMGHACAMLYSTLHLAGYPISREKLKTFRKIGGLPGHPERKLSSGIEMTTGPLGQGFASAVGIAIAKPNNHVYVLASDGDLMEGVSMEAASFAGFKNLKNLTVLWDNNGITIDGHAATSDDIPAKFRAMGWSTIELNGMDSEEIDKALTIAKKFKTPTLLACKTIIGFGSKNQGTEKVHGNPLEYEDAMTLMSKLSLDFERGSLLWKKLSDSKKDSAHRSEEHEIVRLFNVPKIDQTKNYSTRELFNIAIKAAVQNNSSIIVGGSADLSHSTGSIVDAENYIHYGIREHAMGSIMNGLALSGLHPYGGTFLVFSDYMRPAIRMAALMNLPVLFVFSHDSIALGEDGPTHEPIEQLPALRLMPNLNVFRPANFTELVLTLNHHFTSNSTSAIILSRQSFENVPDTPDTDISGYVVFGNKKSKIKIFATGSEVALAIDVANKLNDVAVVSVPNIAMLNMDTSKSFNVWIEASAEIPPFNVDMIFNITKFGESGNGIDVYNKFGFNADMIADKIANKLGIKIEN